MAAIQKEIVERETVRIIGYKVRESLNRILETRIVGKLREQLADRRSEIAEASGDGIYLVQIYDPGGWTHDTPFDHIVGVVAADDVTVPEGMIEHTLPAGSYARFVHRGPESRIAQTYDYINEHHGPRLVDIEFWPDIRALEREDGEIEIYVPIVKTT